MQADYEFASTDGGKTWTRKCFGTEQFVGVMASKLHGFGALTGGYLVSFPRPVSAAVLRAPLEAAWTRLRAAAPVIAYRTKDAKNDDSNNPEYTLYFEYAVPDAQAASDWAAKTIKWHEERMTLRERDIAMKNVWWRAGDGKYSYELHVAPDIGEDKWQIMIHSAHVLSDVRGTLQLSELLFTYLNEYLVLHPEQELRLAIRWGEETAKLTPPSAVVAALTSGIPVSKLFPKPSSASASTSAPAPEANHPAQNGAQGEAEAVEANGIEQKPEQENSGAHADLVLFLRPTPLLNASPIYDAVMTDVWLTKDETVRFRAACRHHGITVTQAITAVEAIAEVEWALTHGEGRSKEEQQQVVEMYEKATHVPCVFNVVDQRYKLKEYARHDSPKGSVPIGSEGFPLMLDMATIRQAVKYNKETGQVERDTSDAVFWGVVAKHCQHLWKSSDTGIPAFLEREVMGHTYSTVSDPSAYMIPGLMSSSIGDIEQLGLLTAFSPSIPSNYEERLLLEQVSISERIPIPVKMVVVWQWNERLLVRPQTAARWTSQQGMDKMGEILRGWIGATCS